MAQPQSKSRHRRLATFPLQTQPPIPRQLRSRSHGSDPRIVWRYFSASHASEIASEHVVRAICSTCLQHCYVLERHATPFRWMGRRSKRQNLDDPTQYIFVEISPRIVSQYCNKLRDRLGLAESAAQRTNCLSWQSREASTEGPTVRQSFDDWAPSLFSSSFVSSSLFFLLSSLFCPLFAFCSSLISSSLFTVGFSCLSSLFLLCCLLSLSFPLSLSLWFLLPLLFFLTLFSCFFSIVSSLFFSHVIFFLLNFNFSSPFPFFSSLPFSHLFCFIIFSFLLSSSLFPSLLFSPFFFSAFPLYFTFPFGSTMLDPQPEMCTFGTTLVL